MCVCKTERKHSKRARDVCMGVQYVGKTAMFGERKGGSVMSLQGNSNFYWSSYTFNYVTLYLIVKKTVKQVNSSSSPILQKFRFLNF